MQTREAFTRPFPYAEKLRFRMELVLEKNTIQRHLKKKKGRELVFRKRKDRAVSLASLRRPRNPLGGFANIQHQVFV